MHTRPGITKSLHRLLVLLSSFTIFAACLISLPPASLAAEPDQCDRLAANPLDPDRVGPGVKTIEDFSTAVAACRAAAPTMRAEYQLGRALEAAGEPREAMQYFLKAAEKGSRIAMNAIGLLYERGRGVGKNDAEAFRWYTKAAEHGLAVSQMNLGLNFKCGRGTAQNLAESAVWLRKAADQGVARAQYLLGQAYTHGLGLPKDIPEAKRWIALAAQGGFADAIVTQAEVEPRGAIDNVPVGHVIRPDGNIPESFAAYSGIWSGSWDYKWPVVIIVRRVLGNGKAEVIYRWVEKMGARWQSSGIIDAELKDGTLTFGWGTLRIDSSDKNMAIGGTNGKTAILVRR